MVEPYTTELATEDDDLLTAVVAVVGPGVGVVDPVSAVVGTPRIGVGGVRVVSFVFVGTGCSSSRGGDGASVVVVVSGSVVVLGRLFIITGANVKGAAATACCSTGTAAIGDTVGLTVYASTVVIGRDVGRSEGERVAGAGSDIGAKVVVVVVVTTALLLGH